MLPDQNPPSSATPPADTEIEPIAPEAAEAILQEAMQPYLDDDWQVIHQSAYLARLTRGTRNIDLQVDLLGQLSKEEFGLTPVQDSGRLMAWIVLLAMMLVALAVSSALGIL